MYDPNLHAIPPNSSHRSIERNSSHHHTRNCPCKSCQWETSVNIPEFQSLSLISGVQDLDKPVIELSPLFEPLAPLTPLDVPSVFPLFSLLLPLPSLLDHDMLSLQSRWT